jgi:hypothetical protein
MNGLEFEIYIANIFAILGYNIQLTKATRWRRSWYYYFKK